MGFLSPCRTEQEAAQLLNAQRTRYFGAKHTVYAYLLHDGTARFSDDGEPHGTAGKPILELLKSSAVCDVILIVSRYFGGVLLGTGGLVRAYTTAAQSALNQAQRVLMSPAAQCRVRCSYGDYEKLKRLIETGGGRVAECLYAADVSLLFEIRLADLPAFSQNLEKAFSSRLSFETIKELYGAF